MGGCNPSVGMGQIPQQIRRGITPFITTCAVVSSSVIFDLLNTDL